MILSTFLKKHYCSSVEWTLLKVTAVNYESSLSQHFLCWQQLHLVEALWEWFRFSNIVSEKSEKLMHWMLMIKIKWKDTLVSHMIFGCEPYVGPETAGFWDTYSVAGENVLFFSSFKAGLIFYVKFSVKRTAPSRRYFTCSAPASPLRCVIFLQPPNFFRCYGILGKNLPLMTWRLVFLYRISWWRLRLIQITTECRRSGRRRLSSDPDRLRCQSCVDKRGDHPFNAMNWVAQRSGIGAANVTRHWGRCNRVICGRFRDCNQIVLCGLLLRFGNSLVDSLFPLFFRVRRFFHSCCCFGFCCLCLRHSEMKKKKNQIVPSPNPTLTQIFPSSQSFLSCFREQLMRTLVNLGNSKKTVRLNAKQVRLTSLIV